MITSVFFTSVAQFEEAASAHVQKLNFPYGNSDCAECQTVVTPENFPYSFLPKSLYSRHSLLLVQYFPLSKFFWYLIYFRPLYQSMLKEVTSFFLASYSLNFVVVYHAIENILTYFWSVVEQQPAEEFTIRHFQQQYPAGVAVSLESFSILV